MTLLASDAISHIRHTLASQDVPDIGALRILNDAGHYLISSHNWAWCEGGEKELPLTDGQAYVWLPDDFREIISIHAFDSLDSGFVLTSQDRLLQLRGMTAANSFHYHAALVHAQMEKAATATVTVNVSTPVVGNNDQISISDGYNPSVIFKFLTVPIADTDTLISLPVPASEAAAAQSLANAINNCATVYVSATASAAVMSVTHDRPGTIGNTMVITPGDSTFTVAHIGTGTVSGPVRPRLDIWPTPSSSVVQGLRVYYRIGWRSAEGDNDMLRIPDWLEMVYLQIVRAFARGYERESDAGVDQRVGVIAQGALMAAAKLRDREMMPNIGPLRGGALQQTVRGFDPVWNFSSTAGPA